MKEDAELNRLRSKVDKVKQMIRSSTQSRVCSRAKKSIREREPEEEDIVYNRNAL